MNYKSYILSTIVCFVSTSIFAQIEQDIIRPSINAGQFSIGAKTETALTKGQLSVNIPLMELKGKGYTLPISLAFYGGDVNSSTEASPIGLGWALMAGGVITKTIKGSDDLKNDGVDREHHHSDDFLHNIYSYNSIEISHIFENIEMDPMPDEYTYSLPGHSGTIDVNMNGGTITRKLYPDESYRIEELESGLCITDDNGTEFYFEDVEEFNNNSFNTLHSASLFLSRIVTAKGGVFTFNYAKEEYLDLPSSDDEIYFTKYRTNRLTSIESDYGSVTFFSVPRSDRGEYGHTSITTDHESERIIKIELRDENGNFVKGYELDNSGWFGHDSFPVYWFWTDIRHKLSTITQYDSLGNRLPPYEFEYSYDFNRSRLVGNTSSASTNTSYLPKDSWTSFIGTQAFANLSDTGYPTSLIDMYDTGSGFYGTAPTVNDFFCISSITYPTGAKDEFAYEEHDYGRINTTRTSSDGVKIQGKRLRSKTRSGNEVYQKTDYIYNLHDSVYNTRNSSSGILTNPSIHRATYYTPGELDRYTSYIASTIKSQRALNSYMGIPVFYTEVEEVEKDTVGILSRTIHYFEPNIVNPPTNYVYVHPYSTTIPSSFVEIENKIFGERHSYSGSTQLFNGVNMTYMAYPVGEFCVDTNFGDQPLKEVFIGEDGRVRSIKRFNYRNYGTFTKYGYKIFREDCYGHDFSNSNDILYSIYRFCKSEHNTRRYRPYDINTTFYYYNGEECDSICENSFVLYSKGRINSSGFGRNDESCSTSYHFPDEITNIETNSSSPEISALNRLIEKNIIADPIKVISKRNGTIIGGECKDYQVQTGIPLTKSIYKIKNTDNNRDIAPIINGNNIDYCADIYTEGEIITYDENLNPEHIRIKETQDRIYVWGYNGRFPVAIIDNMDYASFCTNNTLKSMLRGLAQYTKIESEQECINLRNANAAIRLQLPETAHITTFTYDPNFGITSEMNASNYGLVYTYDTFGRLSAKYDANYKKLEDYTYNLYRQQ